MRQQLTVNPRTHLVCVPRSLASEGMVGRVEAFSGTVTLTLVSPQAGLEDAKASLELVLKDIEHRIALAKRNPQSV